MVRSIKLDLSKKQKLDGGSSNKWRANKKLMMIMILKNSSLCIQKVHQIQLESINEFLLILIVNDFYFLLIFFW